MRSIEYKTAHEVVKAALEEAGDRLLDDEEAPVQICLLDAVEPPLTGNQARLGAIAVVAMLRWQRDDGPPSGDPEPQGEAWCGFTDEPHAPHLWHDYGGWNCPGVKPVGGATRDG